MLGNKETLLCISVRVLGEGREAGVAVTRGVKTRDPRSPIPGLI